MHFIFFSPASDSTRNPDTLPKITKCPDSLFYQILYSLHETQHTYGEEISYDMTFIKKFIRPFPTSASSKLGCGSRLSRNG